MTRQVTLELFAVVIAVLGALFALGLLVRTHGMSNAGMMFTWGLALLFAGWLVLRLTRLSKHLYRKVVVKL